MTQMHTETLKGTDGRDYECKMYGQTLAECPICENDHVEFDDYAAQWICTVCRDFLGSDVKYNVVFHQRVRHDR